MAPQVGVGVGVGVFVLNKQNRIILGERKGSLGAGTYSLAGGHLEAGESFEACAAREVLEETALEVEQLRFLTATNTINLADAKTGELRHYVTIFMVGRLSESSPVEPKLMEPDKCEGWAWISWDEMKAIGDAQLKAREGTGDKDEKALQIRLFEPIISLLKQRPGVSPV
ncbi:hypothetical protein NA57DRAFT_77029 [Rhizodiscina lignyota]|uniref:Nudix hydrolase domain-containing protein n=1 Tax=Rhizodiscina lignyota TaxID=1504668 RepID=A0A9P4IGV7_9PEZI|nr:hypothetical protein NA57DRAFT_77029 [Rhizodiscina lignyota]